MSRFAVLIDEAHKAYRESIGTPNEEPAYEMLVATVRASQSSSSIAFVNRDPDDIMQSVVDGEHY